MAARWRLPAAASLAIVGFLSGAQAGTFDTRVLDQNGSIKLDSIMPLLSKTPPLYEQVSARLRAARRTADAIDCSGARFPGSWTHLGAYRVAPYICAIGGETLTISADVRVSDAEGDSYVRPTAAAMRYAKTFSEHNLRWTWQRIEPQFGRRAPAASAVTLESQAFKREVTSAEPAYIGRWAGELAWCSNDPQKTDAVPQIFSARSRTGYESECRFHQVSGTGTKWIIAEECTGEGERWKSRSELSISGDLMRITERSGSRTGVYKLHRCPAQASGATGRRS